MLYFDAPHNPRNDLPESNLRGSPAVRSDPSDGVNRVATKAAYGYTGPSAKRPIMRKRTPTSRAYLRRASELPRSSQQTREDECPALAQFKLPWGRPNGGC